MEAPPNILRVLCDRLQARWLPLLRHPIVRAPQLDGFAHESEARWSQANI